MHLCCLLRCIHLRSKKHEAVQGNHPDYGCVTVFLPARLFVISFNVPYKVFLSIHFLHGCGFALFYSSIIEHILNISPKDILMTMNFIALSIFFHFSNVVGNIGGSKVYDNFGSRKLFVGQSVICAVWAVVLVIFSARMKMKT